MPDISLRLNARAIRDLERSPEAAEVVELAAERIRDKARTNARSIAPERTDGIVATPADEDATGVYADVGYDKTLPGFVLWWHEVGTRDYPARPHLRPAAGQRVI